MGCQSVLTYISGTELGLFYTSLSPGFENRILKVWKWHEVVQNDTWKLSAYHDWELKVNSLDEL